MVPVFFGPVTATRLKPLDVKLFYIHFCHDCFCSNFLLFSLVFSETDGDSTHLQHSLIIDLVEDSAVDLIGLQRRPVEHGQAEFGLDGLLDSDSCEEVTQTQTRQESCFLAAETCTVGERRLTRETHAEEHGRGGVR